MKRRVGDKRQRLDGVIPSNLGVATKPFSILA